MGLLLDEKVIDQHAKCSLKRNYKRFVQCYNICLLHQRPWFPEHQHKLQKKTLYLTSY